MLALGSILLANVSVRPTDRSVGYVRMWSRINGAWQFTDYAYTATSGVRAQITRPAPGSTLASSTITFVWNTGTGVSEILVGSWDHSWRKPNLMLVVDSFQFSKMAIRSRGERDRQLQDRRRECRNPLRRNKLFG